MGPHDIPVRLRDSAPGLASRCTIHPFQRLQRTFHVRGAVVFVHTGGPRIPNESKPRVFDVTLNKT